MPFGFFLLSRCPWLRKPIGRCVSDWRFWFAFSCFFFSNLLVVNFLAFLVSFFSFVGFSLNYAFVFQATRSSTSTFRLIPGDGLAVLEQIRDAGRRVGRVAGTGGVFDTSLLRVVVVVRRGSGGILFRDVISVHPAFPYFSVTVWAITQSEKNSIFLKLHHFKFPSFQNLIIPNFHHSEFSSFQILIIPKFRKSGHSCLLISCLFYQIVLYSV